MANPEHLAKLKEGVEKWNQWRKANPEVHPDLFAANLMKTDLRSANLLWANLCGSNLSEANLSDADLCNTILCNANLTRANLKFAHLVHADLEGAGLRGVNLWCADLRGASLDSADLTEAQLKHANLQRASLVDASLERADLTNSLVYGVSAWNVNLEGAIQSDLIMTRQGSPLFYSPAGVDQSEEPELVVDDLEVAQFLHMLLNNQKMRRMIDTITSKVVLILGRFTPERKIVLDVIREELRIRGLLPVMFDFAKPAGRDLTETVSTLAHLAHFVIADITDARSIPQELERIVPDLPSVPVQPLLLASQQEYAMFDHFRRYPWVLEPVLYEDQGALLAELGDKVIAPAEAKAKEQAV